MPDFLNQSAVPPATLHIAMVAVRLIIAGALGFVVSWIYRKSRKSTEVVASFPTTLVLLCILIALVTQVIGESTARAFALVGALSIVRFRTIVRDTQDTAYVIFAVAIGMAVGSQNPWAGVVGILVVGAAAFILSSRGPVTRSADQPPFVLNLRLGIGHDLENILRAIDPYVQGVELVSMGTAKQGASLDVTYETRLKSGQNPDDLVKAVNKVEGVQSVAFERHMLEER